ncbi:MAG: 16S rRNA (cytosine(1402)-N(4))-methyltransferase RsmH [Candidatus Niyogibacteria bacterium]|nr:16S rRNA (cytosine(1402)-N(4))-methyltransferase RsmH [Candidatus Niyogibacteria bacterium]
MAHVPVLLEEVIRLLDISQGKIFVDTTADGGGHLEEILKRLPEDGKMIGLDQDEEMIERLRQKFGKDKRTEFIHGNFRDIGSLLSEYAGTVDGILYDLGFSSLQLEESGRGFSFTKDEPLLMTLRRDLGPEDLTAEKIVNDWPEDRLKEIIRVYGEERFAGRIARRIAEERRRGRIRRTVELAEIIRSAVPKNYERGRINPATRAFQALRITVNDELGVLREGLAGGWNLLSPNGRMAVISFHSLEDRIVKNFFRDNKQNDEAEILTKKPIVAVKEELLRNPRARSAKLRAAVKISMR